LQPYIINVDAVVEWWRSAMTSANEQMQHLIDNNDENALLGTLENALRAAIPEDVSDDEREEFVRQALEAAKSDPCHLMFGRIFAEMLSDFMSNVSGGDFREVPGSTITVSPLKNQEGKIRGVEISRSQLDDQEIQEIASNGISGIEDFLKSRVNEQ
jgi:hypothetical protein